MLERDVGVLSFLLFHVDTVVVIVVLSLFFCVFFFRISFSV